MAGTFTVTVQEARGFVAVPADIDRLAVVVGCTSAGSGLSSFYYSASAAITGVGYGDAVDTLCQIIEQRQSTGTSVKYPAAIYSTGDNGAAGSYGTIDISGVTGTADPANDTSVEPYLTAHLKVRIVDGGTVGTAGITYQRSWDNGINWDNTRSLGAATSISFPNTNAGFVLTPPSATLTALYSKLNDLKDKLTGTGHFVLTSGTVHGSADTTNDTALAAITNASTPATGVTLFNGIKTYLGAHGANATVHTIADTALATALAAIPTATNIADVDLYTDNLVAAYEAHRVNLSVHGAADSTYTVAAYTPGPGTLVAEDTWTARIFAPAPSATDLYDPGGGTPTGAFVDLANSSAQFSLVVLEFPLSATLAATVTTGINYMLARGKRVAVLARTRLPTFESSESESTWLASVAADFANFTDSRICARAGYALITDATTTRQYLRSTLAQFAADVVRIPRALLPSVPADQAEANVTLIDASGALVGHDEGPRGNATGLSNETLGNRFSCEARIVGAQRAEAVYNTVPWVLYDEDEHIRNLAVRRLANAMERVAVAAGTSQLGGQFFYTPADPEVPGSQNILTEPSRNALHAVIFGALAEQFAGEIGNADDADGDSGLVQVNPAVTVSGGNLLGVEVTLAPLVGGFLLDLEITLAIRE